MFTGSRKQRADRETMAIACSSHPGTFCQGFRENCQTRWCDDWTQVLRVDSQGLDLLWE